MGNPGILSSNNLVFIDSRVPDIQTLIAGIAPGDQVFVIDPGSDGMDQIAAILAAQDASGLDSISIVGHGAPGSISIGSSLLDDSDLAQHAAALSAIGATLSPDGQLDLYACDTAQGAAGLQFLSDLSAYAGGIDVAASTHIVGGTASGGSFVLDAATGALPAAAPFTQTAMENYQGDLSATATGQLWFSYVDANGNPTSGVGYINTDGSSQTTIGKDPQTSPSSSQPYYYIGLGLDTATGFYFGLSTNFNATNGSQELVVGNLATGAQIGSALSVNPGDYNVVGEAVDPINHYVYLGVWGDSEADTGIVRISYNPTTGALPSSIISGGVIAPGNFIVSESGGATITNPIDLALDATHQKLYVVAEDLNLASGSGLPWGAPYPDSNGIYVINLANNSTTEVTSTSQFPATNAGFHNTIISMAVDTTNGIIYFLTQNMTGSGGQNPSLWYISTSSTGGNATPMSVPSVALHGFEYNSLTFDPASRSLYLSDVGDQVGGVPSYIDKLVLSGDGHSIASAGNFITPDTGNNVAPAQALVFNALPVLSVSGTGTHAGEQGSAITLAASLNSSDSDGGYYKGATVQITGGTFSSNENSTSDDHLTIGGSSSGTVNGITYSYNSGTETLTLSGYDTIAHYNAALAQVQFNTTGDNPTNYGSNTSRTVTWTVSDGSSNVPSGSQNSTTTTILIDAVDDPALISGTTTGSVTEDGTLTASGSLSASDPDNMGGGSAFQSASSTSTYGSWSITAGGGWTYNLNNANSSVQGLNIGQTLADFFTVQSAGGTSQQIAITIHGTNDAAIVGGATSGSVTEDVTATATGTLTDTDVDNTPNTFLAVSSATTSANGYGTYTMTADGGWTYNLNNGNSTVNGLNAGSTLNDSFTVQTQDGTSQQVSITIHGTNDAAIVSGATSGSVIEDSALTATGTLTDTDVDNTPNTFQAASTSGNYGSWSITTGGDWTYNLDNANAAVQSLNVGQTRTDSFTAQTQDGTAQLVTITIQGTNDAAIISGDTSGSVTEAGGVGNNLAGTAVAFGTLTDTDIDNAADTFQAVSSATSVNGYGSYTMGADGNWTYALDDGNTAVEALNSGDTLSDTFIVLTQDGTSQQVSITINGADDAPVLAAGASVGYTENSAPVALDPGLTIGDVDNTNLTGATVTISGGVDGDQLVFTDQNGITGHYDSSSQVLTLTGSASLAQYQAALQSVAFSSISENPDADGTAPSRSISWSVSDGALSGSGGSTVGITPINSAPSGADGSVGITHGQSHVFAASEFGFSDADGNSLLAVEITSLPTIGSLTDNGVVVTAGQFIPLADITTGKLIYAPASDPSNASFTFQVQDNGGTANDGHDTDATPNTLTIYVEPYGDFNGDGNSDLLWLNSAANKLSIWEMTNPGYTANDLGNALPAGWSVVGTADFNNDGKSDILLQNNVTNKMVAWLMNGFSHTSLTLGNLGAGSKVVGVGDFNDDGHPDIVFQNTSNGKISIRLSDGSQLAPGVVVADRGTDWSVAAIGDFNGDGHSDLLLRSSITGRVDLVAMNGTDNIPADGGKVGSNLSWNVVATGDLNGDGTTDVILQNPNNSEVSIWLMDGKTRTLAADVATPGVGWTVTGSGDFNNDGKSDILLQNTSGQAQIWYMNGATMLPGSGLVGPARGADLHVMAG